MSTEPNHQEAFREIRDTKSYVFKVVVEEDESENREKAYHAYCPALKGCHTWGRTYDEGLANAREAIELYLEDLRESDRRCPSIPGTVRWSGPRLPWQSTMPEIPRGVTAREFIRALHADGVPPHPYPWQPSHLSARR